MKKTLLQEKDIAILQSFEEGSAGYYGKMLHYLFSWLEQGVKEGRFSREEAETDLEVALWIAYACNNIDDYEHYFLAAQWLAKVEAQAAHCGTWYYRYSCALMYCGKLEQALAYAEKGAKAEPDYPWIWLQLAKLRSHFGDVEGALAANAAGLALVPGDYEFLRQDEELRQGYSLEALEHHYINAGDDQDLLSGRIDDSEKLAAIAGIVCDVQRLERIKAILKPTQWLPDQPYCLFQFHCCGHLVDGVFCMNEAAVSKLSLTWLQDVFMQWENCQPIRQSQGERADEFVLQAVAIRRDLSLTLSYYHEQSGQSISIEQGVHQEVCH